MRAPWGPVWSLVGKRGWVCVWLGVMWAHARREHSDLEPDLWFPHCKPCRHAACGPRCRQAPGPGLAGVGAPLGGQDGRELGVHPAGGPREGGKPTPSTLLLPGPGLLEQLRGRVLSGGWQP